MPVYIEQTILERCRASLINGGRRGYLVGIDATASALQLLDGQARALRAGTNERVMAKSAPPMARRRPCCMDASNPFLPLILATVAAAYLLGSLSFAVIVSRAHGPERSSRTYRQQEPRCATNVLRSGSKAAAVVTLLLDALKGWLPVVLVRWFGKPYGLEDGTVALVGLAAFLGHLWPVFFRFQGGKGVATFIGVVFGVDLLLGLATGATWLIIAYFFRYSSLASLVSAAFAPVFYLMGDRIQWYSERAVLFMLFIMALLLAVRHRENINRLLEGKESKLGTKK
jgi:glycerol-3-phosphate acyltransferase PlsY